MQTTTLAFELKTRCLAYQGFFKLEQIELRHQLFAGGWSPLFKRELLRRKAAVVVLVYDPKLDAILMLEQFRIGATGEANPWLVELVAGLVEDGEAPEQVARREAFEEAGVHLHQPLQLIQRYFPSPGGSDEVIWLYVTQSDLSQVEGIHGLASEHEDIRPSVVPRAEAMQWLATGQINNAASIIALQWLALNPDWRAG